jgi:hypothetical protein
MRANDVEKRQHVVESFRQIVTWVVTSHTASSTLKKLRNSSFQSYFHSSLNDVGPCVKRPLRTTSGGRRAEAVMNAELAVQRPRREPLELQAAERLTDTH